MAARGVARHGRFRERDSAHPRGHHGRNEPWRRPRRSRPAHAPHPAPLASVRHTRASRRPLWRRPPSPELPGPRARKRCSLRQPSRTDGRRSLRRHRPAPRTSHARHGSLDSGLWPDDARVGVVGRIALCGEHRGRCAGRSASELSVSSAPRRRARGDRDRLLEPVGRCRLLGVSLRGPPVGRGGRPHRIGGRKGRVARGRRRLRVGLRLAGPRGGLVSRPAGRFPQHHAGVRDHARLRVASPRRGSGSGEPPRATADPARGPSGRGRRRHPARHARGRALRPAGGPSGARLLVDDRAVAWRRARGDRPSDGASRCMPAPGC